MSTQIHPAVLLTPPHHESPVAVDEEMVPAVQSIWARGWRTAACCQDAGEATEGERAAREHPSEPTGNAGFIDYYRGWSWLKLPRPDALAFLSFAADRPEFRDRVTVRWGRGSWRMHSPVIWTEDGFMVTPYVQIYLPREQLSELAAVLA